MKKQGVSRVIMGPGLYDNLGVPEQQAPRFRVDLNFDPGYVGRIKSHSIIYDKPLGGLTIMFLLY